MIRGTACRSSRWWWTRLRRSPLWCLVSCSPGLNQLLCFATFVGVWKEIDPRKAIAIKRDLDQIMYATSQGRPLLTTPS